MKKSTEIIIVLDRSGSMSSIRKETISGFNEFLMRQKEENPDSTITMVQFNHHYYPVYRAEPTKKAAPLSDSTYVTGGMTALLDAIGKTIKSVVKRHKETKEEERPDKVLFVIITDGYENSSVKYDRKKIFKKIRKMEERYGWEFVYLGANQDAIHEAKQYGISDKKAMTFAHDKLGMEDAFMSISKQSIAYCVKNHDFAFDEEDRKKHKRDPKDHSSGTIFDINPQ